VAILRRARDQCYTRHNQQDAGPAGARNFLMQKELARQNPRIEDRPHIRKRRKGNQTSNLPHAPAK